MSVVIKLAETPFDKKMLALKALKNELFYPGWMLEGELRKLATDQAPYLEICVAYAEKKTVGVSLYFREGKHEGHITEFKKSSVVCFVQPEFRLKGIGRQLINGIGVPPAQMQSYYGTSTSPTFWKKVGTDYRGMFSYG